MARAAADKTCFELGKTCVGCSKRERHHRWHGSTSVYHAAGSYDDDPESDKITVSDLGTGRSTDGESHAQALCNVPHGAWTVSTKRCEHNYPQWLPKGPLHISYLLSCPTTRRRALSNATCAEKAAYRWHSSGTFRQIPSRSTGDGHTTRSRRKGPCRNGEALTLFLHFVGTFECSLFYIIDTGKKVAGCMSGFWRLGTPSKWHVTC